MTMNVYQHPTEKRTFYAPDRRPTVNLSAPLWHISGLNNYSIPRPNIAPEPGATPRPEWIGPRRLLSRERLAQGLLWHHRHA